VYASYIDEPVMRSGGGGNRYYHRNQQYSVIALSDGGGTIKERYAYDAYGGLTILSSSLSPLTTSAENNRYTYTGREFDEALDLYHYRARVYDSATGRFCSRDPIGYVDGNNLYQLTAGNSTTFVDPHGLCGQKCGVKHYQMVQAVRPGLFNVGGTLVHYLAGYYTTIDFENTDPYSCSCCAFRQDFMYHRSEWVITSPLGRKRPPVVSELPPNHDDGYGQGNESHEGLEGTSDDGCRYVMQDFMSHKLDAFLPFINNPAWKNARLTVSRKARVRHRVLDVCNDNEVVFSNQFLVSSTFSYTFGGLKKLLDDPNPPSPRIDPPAPWLND
jgi:RHS repeat-associated protein